MSKVDIRRVGFVYAGGPAPASNSTIAAAATSFLAAGIEVVGFVHGYSNLERYDLATPLIEGEDYRILTEADTRGLRNARGVLIGTARAHPAAAIECRADLKDPAKTAKLARVHRALVDLEIDALVSIGGDGTLRTAGLLHAYQETLGPEVRRVRIVHLPKTIDNDYDGIDFTFGYFTAVDILAKEILNLTADAIATSSYYIVETMGRRAGWIAYGVAIAGEANLVLGVEDLERGLSTVEIDSSGQPQRKLDFDALVDRIVDLIIAREDKRHRHYGIVVLAEGLAKCLPSRFEGDVDFPKLVAKHVGERHVERTGRKKKVVGLQLGYEARSAAPHAFDVVLGSQLGVGAYRALVEEKLDAHMVSVKGQFSLQYVPFSSLLDPDTFWTRTRYVDLDGDFYKLARFLERRVDRPDAPRRARREDEGL